VPNLNFVLESLESTVTPAQGASAVSDKSLMDSLHDEILQFNQRVPEQQQVSESVAKVIIKREEENGHPRAMRAVAQYLNTLENPDTNTPTEHRDLLPKNHPLSTKWLSKFEARKQIASYYKTDTRIEDEEVRSLVASAISHEPDTAQRFFFNEVLLAKTSNAGILALIGEADKIVERRKGKKND